MVPNATVPQPVGIPMFAQPANFCRELTTVAGRRRDAVMPTLVAMSGKHEPTNWPSKRGKLGHRDTIPGWPIPSTIARCVQNRCIEKRQCVLGDPSRCDFEWTFFIYILLCNSGATSPDCLVAQPSGALCAMGVRRHAFVIYFYII